MSFFVFFDIVTHLLIVDIFLFVYLADFQVLRNTDNWDYSSLK